MKPKILPFISVGIIFKNEMRCIERCLKSLLPLKKMLPCEIVMADTGSTDGSREIAEKYADIVFDFPWINDFAAARNAVMDRCSGKWYFTVDSDEWLDGSLSGLALFAMINNKSDFATINVRSFLDNDFASENYSEFTALRLVRMSTGQRYKGPIHEYWETPEGASVWCMDDNIRLLHDGYVPEIWRAKGGEERNTVLLKKLIADDPQDLRSYSQLIECCGNIQQIIEYGHTALEVLKEKPRGWQSYGPSILRHCVNAAFVGGREEIKDWIQQAQDWFPDSLYTQIDTGYCACCLCLSEGDYTKCVEYGEKYCEAIEQYRNRGYDVASFLVGGAMTYIKPLHVQRIIINLISAYVNIGQTENAMKYARQIKGAELNRELTETALVQLQKIYARKDPDTVSIILHLWYDIQNPKPNKEQAEERKEQFLRTAIKSFTADCWNEENEDADVVRHSCMAFKGLKHPLGDAVALLEETDPVKLEKQLLSMENWKQIPVFVLGHVIKCGVRFPLPGDRITLKRMRNIAKSLSNEATDFPIIVQRAVQSANEPDTLAWAQVVVTVALYIQNWKDNNDAAWDLYQDFVNIEKRFLCFYFAETVLTKENAILLPPEHRFGLYCCMALDAKNHGNLTECVSWLHKCLDTVPQMNEMISFLMGYIKVELKKNAPPEVLELAKKVKAILSQYAPDDPAVLELKNSPAYQNVAPYLV